MDYLKNLLDMQSWSTSKRLLLHAALQMLMHGRLEEYGEFSDLEEYYCFVGQALRMRGESPAILSLKLNNIDAALRSWIQTNQTEDHEEVAKLMLWLMALNKSVNDLSEKRAKQLLGTLLNVPGTDIFFSEDLYIFCSNALDDFSQSGGETLKALPILCQESIEDDGKWYDSNHFDISQLPSNKQVLLHSLGPAIIGPLAKENTRFSGFRQYSRAADSVISLRSKGDVDRCAKAAEKANQSFTRLVSDLRQHRLEELYESRLATDVYMTLMGLLHASRQISEMEPDEADNLLKAINSEEKGQNTAGKIVSEMMVAHLSAKSEKERTHQLNEMLSSLEIPDEKWTGKTVSSYMKTPNYAFRSSQPEVYYKKKIQDILHGFRFENDEYFMALVIMLHNWSQTAIDYANQQDWSLNMEILDAVLWETMQNILYGELGKIIKKRADLKDELQKMLRNAVRIMAYSANFYTPDINHWLLANYSKIAPHIKRYLNLTPLLGSFRNNG